MPNQRNPPISASEAEQWGIQSLLGFASPRSDYGDMSRTPSVQGDLMMQAGGYGDSQWGYPQDHGDEEDYYENTSEEETSEDDYEEGSQDEGGEVEVQQVYQPGGHPTIGGITLITPASAVAPTSVAAPESVASVDEAYHLSPSSPHYPSYFPSTSTPTAFRALSETIPPISSAQSPPAESTSRPEATAERRQLRILRNLKPWDMDMAIVQDAGLQAPEGRSFRERRPRAQDGTSAGESTMSLSQVEDVPAKRGRGPGRPRGSRRGRGGRPRGSGRASGTKREAGKGRGSAEPLADVTTTGDDIIAEDTSNPSSAETFSELNLTPHTIPGQSSTNAAGRVNSLGFVMPSADEKKEQRQHRRLMNNLIAWDPALAAAQKSSLGTEGEPARSTRRRQSAQSAATVPWGSLHRGEKAENPDETGSDIKQQIRASSVASTRGRGRGGRLRGSMARDSPRQSQSANSDTIMVSGRQDDIYEFVS